MQRLNSDGNLYLLQQGDHFVVIAVYVDDCLIVSNNHTVLKDVKIKLMNRFVMKDLGAVRQLLGMEVDRDEADRTITLTQCQYVKKLLNQFNMTSCKSVATPVVTGIKFTSKMDDLFDQPSVYRSLVGGLLYLANMTRPDISFAVGLLSRYMQSPSCYHWQMVKRVLRYLKGTAAHGLVYKCSGQSKLVLQAYCDADWAGNLDTRHSTSGICCIIAGAPVSWGSKKQTTVALSSAEAEYVAASTAAREIIWLRRLLGELNQQQSDATILHCDSRSAIAMSKNPVFHARTKHIDVQHHFIREHVAAGDLHLEYVPSQYQLADLLTKPLSELTFIKLRNQLGVSSTPSA
ncbi:uncharacterized protein LOC112341862 [Selaginella moellendorffii]|uniref:uncharacterized protein LOC112341862 n=1 Tax=Selaginella moellendorffii TaxID=88036 RepID=UPI000D1CB006|nr:uncharacterized protein LOC112341862 [Selaginella moellendorffii]|eukprot:XP_024518486.1 uncharacterized protein LOC112341862 [Selaginella moellendorffii]